MNKQKIIYNKNNQLIIVVQIKIILIIHSTIIKKLIQRLKMNRNIFKIRSRLNCLFYLKMKKIYYIYVMFHLTG